VSGKRGIYSLYLTEAEEARIKQVAEANGSSVNFVVRVAVRKLLGLKAPALDLEPANSSD
jgi:hypothetical protein